MANNTEMFTRAGITAPFAIWAHLGFQVDKETGLYPQSASAPTDGQLIFARAQSGFTDERALAWFIADRRRAAEEEARNRAMTKHGDDLIHAARINRQAALIEAKVSGVKVELEDL